MDTDILKFLSQGREAALKWTGNLFSHEGGLLKLIFRGSVIYTLKERGLDQVPGRRRMI
jgi:hypothetical protein